LGLEFADHATVAKTRRRLYATSGDRLLVSMQLAPAVLLKLANSLHFLSEVQSGVCVDWVHELERSQLLIRQALHFKSSGCTSGEALSADGVITDHALRHKNFDGLMSGFSNPHQYAPKVDRDSLRPNLLDTYSIPPLSKGWNEKRLDPEKFVDC